MAIDSRQQTTKRQRAEQEKLGDKIKEGTGSITSAKHARFDSRFAACQHHFVSPVYSSFATFGFQLSVSHPLFSCLLLLALVFGVVVSVTLSRSGVYHTILLRSCISTSCHVTVIAGHRTQEEWQKIEGKQQARLELLVLPIATACYRRVCMNVAAASYGRACHYPLRSPANPPALPARHALNTAHHAADRESRDHR